MLLAQKQTHGSMKQNRELRNKPTLTWAIYDKGGRDIQWGKILSSINGVEKTGQLLAKN